MKLQSINWSLAIPEFIKDAKAIFADERTRLVTFPDLVVRLAYLGGGHLFLGHAIQAWASGALSRPCPKCKLKAYVTWASGSPLSGAGGWSGVCRQCGPVHETDRVTGLVRNPKVLGHWASLGYQPILQAASPWTFSFVEGAVQQGDKAEIRLQVPGWREFILDYDSSLLIESRGEEVEETQSERFGMTIRGKHVTLGGRLQQIDREQPL